MRYVGPRQIVIDDRPTPTPYWEPERLFVGLEVAVIGGGPSLARVDLARLAGQRFIVVNSGCRRLLEIATADDILYFTDNSWNENRPDLARSWPGMVVTANRNAKARLGDAVRYIDVTALTIAMGAAPDYVQASSGHIAACLAARMGATRIVLLAFEGRAIAGQTHGHADYSQHDTGVFEERFLPGWRGLEAAFVRLGVEVVNATPDSAIECFPAGRADLVRSAR